MILPLTLTTKAQETKKEKISIEKRTQNRVNHLSEKLELSKEQAEQLYELKLSDAKERKVEREKLLAKIKAKEEADKLKMKSILTEKQYEQYLELRGAEKMKRKTRRKHKREAKRKTLEKK